MKYIIISSVIYAVLLASTISSPVGPSQYGGPHSINSLQRSAGYRQGGYHSQSSRGSPYGGGASQLRGHVPSATFGSPYGAPGPRHIPGPVSTHGDLPRNGAYGGYSGSYNQGPSGRYNGGGGRGYGGNGYGQGPTATGYQRGESRVQNYGREMKYTVRDPHSRGTTHVTETHVVSNKQMHGAEAEAAMKKIMGSMGSGGGGYGGIPDFVKDMGLPFY